MQRQTVTFLLLCFSFANADIFVYLQNSSRFDLVIPSMSAFFGSPIPTKGLKVFLTKTPDSNICSDLDPPPNEPNFTGNWGILLQDHENCSISESILAAQNASYDLVLIEKFDSELGSKWTESTITVHSVVVNERNGALLREKYLFTKGFYLVVKGRELAVRSQSSGSMFTYLLTRFCILWTGALAISFIIKVLSVLYGRIQRIKLKPCEVSVYYRDNNGEKMYC